LLANPEAGLLVPDTGGLDLTPTERRRMKASIDNELRERRCSPWPGSGGYSTSYRRAWRSTNCGCWKAPQR